MKTRLYSFVFFCSMLLLFQQSDAQCGIRYKDMVFPNVTKTTVTFSDTFNLQMDIYEPTGDTATVRPLLVLAHGGSFVSGDRTNDNVVTTMCTNFAMRGYVTASIDYRLGNIVNMYLDSTYAINEVLQSIGDGKAAVRWFRKDAYTTNTYRVDTTHFYCGGNSAGGVLFMHYIYIDSVNEAPAALRNIIINNGGIEGNSGNAGYSSTVHACLSMAGGLNEPEFVGPGSKPIAHFQGDQDVTVPYNCALAEQGAVKVRLCGLGAEDPFYVANGVTHISVVFPGDQHVPWATDNAKMTKVDTMSANFLDTVGNFPVQYVCTATSVNNLTEDENVLVFPNPTLGAVNINFKEISSYNKVQLIDAVGRLVEEKQVTSQMLTFDRNNVNAGVYLLRIVRRDASTVVKKVVFE